MDKSKEILKKYWGFDQFRPLQEEIIDAVLYGHDTLALLPTGGGKSLCFQVPGIAREGLTLVISPLIALMQDQVKNLQKKGIRAKEITSGMSYREIDITLDNACFGGLDFLYTSPERIQSKLFIERFKRMNIGLIVVDEAHCISEWGHDFRPPYKEIYKLREIHQNVPIIALTATATNEVKEDIVKQLKLKTPQLFQGPFTRKNLTFKVFQVDNKIKYILSFCKKYPDDCGIIYCQTRKSVKDVAKLLHATNFSVGIYHGGMEQEDRKMMLEAWLSGKIQIMIATNAFGMGIDKSNVRFVLHYEFPNNLEAYFQEAGRAGRDQLPSQAIVFWEHNDIEQLQYRISMQFPPIETIKLTYRALCNFLKIAIGAGNQETYHFNISELIQKFKLSASDTYQSLKILELNNDLVFSEGVFHPTRLQIVIGNKELYNFQIKQEKLSPLISFLSRNYPGIFSDYQEIKEVEIAKRLNITHPDLKKQLTVLEQYGIIDIHWQSSEPSVTFLHERLPDDYLQISPDVYLERKHKAEKRLEKAIEYLEKKQCRNKMLLTYFGEASTDCGKCDYCLQKYSESDKSLQEQIIQHLKSESMDFDTIISTINASSKEVIEQLQLLLLEEKIIEKEGVFILKPDLDS